MTFRTIKNAATRLMASLLALPAVPALAASADQAFQKGSDAINWVFLGLTSMSVVTISCAVAFIAYKMLVDGKAWHDLQRVFWSGVLLAGASGFGAYFAA
ncbi:TrbC/VirB2 family protein [Enterobacter bugandensis]|jgi:type IV secretion system protein VirB2|uniref:TrbC/VirB2 family protein n=1 Tax=Gammaproteobacteria TaxID=1236 RepID=UPI000DCF3385|nr:MULTISPECIES: TrbC/VirB2 family protein [Gammaproteobacteria]MCK7359446.1 TrbC/VirB2 family protein [Enterobacter roggenkampii]RAY79767.1 conjugal transfer protein TrbC [Enterobacter cloacae]HCM9645922.1 conjugal transfer protein TrbC [Enterobacter hormaechei subsp. xiangfangensis]MBF2751029.1 conjugal transfer protein TrbC [Enterobacter bugandensis]MBF2803752.1 conjugal transfer protein TrbC [Enterobacter bugandensis]